MCADPITLTVIGATLFSAATTAAQGFSAANVQRYNAQQERQAGYQKETLARNDATRQIADQTVTLANSGANPDSGTPLLLLGESARNSELDALSIRQTGLNRGASYDAQAKGSEMNGLFGAGAQLLNGAVKLQQLGAINPGGAGGGTPPGQSSGPAVGYS